MISVLTYCAGQPLLPVPSGFHKFTVVLPCNQGIRGIANPPGGLAIDFT